MCDMKSDYTGLASIKFIIFSCYTHFVPKSQFYTPLMYACEGGHARMVELLLNNKPPARIDYVGGHEKRMQGHRKVRTCTSMHILELCTYYLCACIPPAHRLRAECYACSLH